MKPVFFRGVDLRELFVTNNEVIDSGFDPFQEPGRFDVDRKLGDGEFAVLFDENERFLVEHYSTPCFKRVLRIRMINNGNFGGRRLPPETLVLSDTMEQNLLTFQKNEHIVFIACSDKGQSTIVSMFRAILRDGMNYSLIKGARDDLLREKQKELKEKTENIETLQTLILNRKIDIRYTEDFKGNKLMKTAVKMLDCDIGNTSAYVNNEFTRFFNTRTAKFGSVLIELNNENEKPVIVVHAIPDVDSHLLLGSIENNGECEDLESFIYYLAHESVGFLEDNFNISALYEGDWEQMENWLKEDENLRRIVDLGLDVYLMMTEYSLG